MSSRLCRYYDDFTFNARWITCPGADVPNCCAEFFTSFDCRNEAEAGFLRIAAESYYMLYVNGVFIGRGPVRGTWSSNYFDTYDLTGIIRKGENRVSVLVSSMNSKNTFNTHPAGCAFIAEIPGVLQSSSQWRARLKPGWSNTTRNFAFQQGFKIEYDLSKDDDAVISGKNIDSWGHAENFVSGEVAAKKLLPRGIPPLKETVIIPKLIRSAAVETGTVAPGEDIGDLLNREVWHGTDKIAAAGENEYLIENSSAGMAMVFDLGKPSTGIFEVEIESGAGTRVDVTYGEELWNGRVRASYRESDCNEMYFYTDTYFLRSGSNKVSNFFMAHGGSVIQLVFRDLSGPVRVRQVRFIDRRYPYREAAGFSCSDLRLNRIWQICRETLSACTTDTFEDCPWREHAFWVNDLIVENLTSLVLFGPSDIHRRSLELIFAQQYDSGWCTAVVPVKYDPEKPSNILPATNFFLFSIIADYYRESGDIKTVRRYLPNLEKILSAAEKECNEEGLTAPPEHSWNFYDWGFELNLLTFNHQRDSILNSFYIIAMKEFCKLCEAAGVDCDRKMYEQRISRVTAGLKKRLQEGNGVFMDPVCRIVLPSDDRIPDKIASELSLGVALQSRVWDDEQCGKFVEHILSGKLLQPEFYLSGMVFRELARFGHGDEVLRRIRKYWGKVVDLDLPAVPETGVYKFAREAFRQTGTYCHGFATYPVHFLRENILGIKALEPGFKTFEFAPECWDLTFASGDVHTPGGTVFVRWEKSADSGILSVELNVPAGCRACLRGGGSMTAGFYKFKFDPASGCRITE